MPRYTDFYPNDVPYMVCSEKKMKSLIGQLHETTRNSNKKKKLIWNFIEYCICGVQKMLNICHYAQENYFYPQRSEQKINVIVTYH